MSEYSIFRFLRFLPIPDTLKVSVPGLDILSKKVPLPPVLEKSISLRSLFVDEKKAQIRKRVVKKTEARAKAPEQGAADITAQGILGRGLKTNFSVGGKDIHVTDTTWIFGELRVGSKVQVFGPIDRNDIISALKIIVL